MVLRGHWRFDTEGCGMKADRTSSRGAVSWRSSGSPLCCIRTRDVNMQAAGSRLSLSNGVRVVDRVVGARTSLKKRSSKSRNIHRCVAYCRMLMLPRCGEQVAIVERACYSSRSTARPQGENASSFLLLKQGRIPIRQKGRPTHAASR